MPDLVKENTDREMLRQRQWPKLRSLLRAAADDSAFYREKLAGIAVAGLRDGASFCSLVPFTTKQELLEDRRARRPFGGNLTRPLGEYTRFCQTSGTSTGEPMAWLDTPQSWEAMLACWRRVYAAAGVRRGADRLFFAFSFGPFLGFWTAFEAAAQDFLVIPGGGLSSQGRLQAMARYGATVLCCTPTYAMRLGEQIGGDSGVSLDQLQLHTIIVAGEAGGSLPTVRERIGALWGGARVFDHHGMTEVGPVTYELPDCPGMLAVIEEAYFAEVIDPQTGREVEDGDCGELVLTTLDRAACPLLRYRTGDWVRKRIIAGRLCLEGGILSRVDDMVVVRGVNVYPSAVESIVREFAEVAEFAVEARKVDAMDELFLRVELTPNASASAAKRIEARLKEAFALRIPVIIEPCGALPRHEFKARRWQV